MLPWKIFSFFQKPLLGKFSNQTDTDDFSLQILGYALIVNYLFNCHSNSLIRPTHQSLEWISSTLEKIPLSEGVQVRVMSWCKSWNEFFFPEGVIQTLVFCSKTNHVQYWLVSGINTENTPKSFSFQHSTIRVWFKPNIYSIWYWPNSLCSQLKTQ